ncbi:CorA family divalent cation transporter [Nakamurella sp. GG22]
MTITSPAQVSGTDRPLRSVLWRGDRTVATDLPADRIATELAGDPEIKAWWFLPREAAALAGTATLMGLDRLAVDDVLGARETPKVDTVGSTVIVVTGALLFNPRTTELTIARVSILADPRALVVVAGERELARLAPTLEDCAGRMRAEGIGAALHIVLEALVQTYTSAVEAMEEATDGLTSSLFDDRPMGRADQLTAFRLRQAISHLRRLAAPMTEVTATLAAAAARPEDEQVDDPIAALLGTSIRRRFADVADHARHAADATNGLREMLTSAFETNLALSDVHLNMIMKKLSAWAAIIAVPTLITGFFGMNVPYPGFGRGEGFVFGLVIMVSAVITLYVLFKRSDWL